MRLRLLFWEVIKESYFYHTVLIPIKCPFYISPQNRKFLTLSFQHHLRNIAVRLWMREERKKSFQRSFIIFLLSLIERKRLINIAIMSIFHLLIARFHWLRAFPKKRERKVWFISVEFNWRRYKKTTDGDVVWSVQTDGWVS